MTDVRKIKIRFIAVLLCALMLVSLFVPIMGTRISNQAEAAEGTITFYFDTGGGMPDNKKNNNNYGWSKLPQQIVYHISSDADSNDNGVTGLLFKSNTENSAVMTLTTIKSKKDSVNGKIYKATVPSSLEGKYLSFSPYYSDSGEHKQSGYYRTSRRNPIKVRNNIVVYLSNNEQDGYWQSWYYDLKEEDVANYAGSKFKIANLTESNVSFRFEYTSADETKTISGQVVPARTLDTQFEIPAAESGKAPYTSIKIIREIDEKIIKNYTFSTDSTQDKIRGKTLVYGITQYAEETPDYADDADYKTLSFSREDYGSYTAVTDYLYLAKEGFKEDKVHNYSSINVKIDGNYYSVEEVTTGGNAAYVTTQKIPVAANKVFSIYCTYDTNKTDIYNLVWNDASKNLCILGYGDVAQVTDEYSVQSTENELNGQKYITVKADFFDYQYDSMNGSRYYFEKYNGGGSHNSANEASKLGKSKRPFLAINEAISASDYGNTSVPMYLGQFWLPDKGGDSNSPAYSDSSAAYNNATAVKQRAGNNSGYDTNINDYNNERYYYSDTQSTGSDTFIGFGNILNNFNWGANLAFRTNAQKTGTHRPYDAVAQGLVSGYLEGSNATNYVHGGRLMSNTANVSIPYFDKTWWNGIFTTSQNGAVINKADYLNLYENLDFPFFEITKDEIKFQNGYSSTNLLSDPSDKYNGKYYVFDSKEYSVKVNTSGAKPTLDKSNKKHKNSSDDTDMVYDNYGSDGKYEGTSKGQQLGLFPFNSHDDGGYKGNNLHYGFGIRYDIDFYMTETGTVDGSPDGTAMTFTFQGDDDVWVFLDGKLILDMGGGHKNALGEINFKSKKAWISAIGKAATNNIVSDNTTNGLLNDSVITRARNDVTTDFNTSEWASRLTEGEHTITMFYMERGMLNSNLYCMFNLPSNITKLQLQNDTDFSKVNSAFLAATKYVADSDVFNYEVSNKNTSSNLGSTYDSPSGENIWRNNTVKTGSTAVTKLSSSTNVTTTTTEVIDSDYLYLKVFDDWKNDNAISGIIMFDDNGLFRFQTFEDAGDGYYRTPVDDRFKKFVVIRLKPGTYETQEYTSDGWNSIVTYLYGINGEAAGFWNRATSFGQDGVFDLANKNVYKVNGWSDDTSWSSTSKKKTVTSTNQHTYDFNYSATSVDGYVPMISTNGGVTYELRDYMATNSSGILPVVTDSRKYNGTGSQNIVSLQYGELASFNKQFEANSHMKVTLLNNLSAPTSGNRVDDSDYNDATGRTVSKYYSTYVKSQNNEDGLKKLPSPGIYNGKDVSGIPLNEVNEMYEQSTGTDYTLKTDLSGKNYSNNTVINLQRNKTGEDVVTTYSFSDPEKGSNTNVFLRQVFVNAVNTADLKLSKYMTGEDIDKEFTFTIKFSNIFGSDDSTANSLINVSALRYYLDDGTEPKEFFSTSDVDKSVTFKIHPNHSVTIKGIPVGTKYYISEADDASYVLDKDSSVNLRIEGGKVVPAEITEDMDVSWFNKRKTGAIKLRKILYESDGTTKITTNTDDFEFVINCTAPSGVAIASYPLKYHTSADTTTVLPLTWIRTEIPGSDPLAYRYSIVINVKPEQVEHNQDIIIEGLPVGTTYTAEENITGAYAMMAVDYTPGTGDSGDKTIEKLYTGSTMDDAIDLIKISNKIVPIVMPTTGGNGVILLLPFGILAIALSGAALLIYKKKTENGYVIRKGRYMSKNKNM